MEERSFVGAYLDGDREVVALYRHESGTRCCKRFKASWDSFHAASDLTPQILSTLRRTRQVRGIREEGKFVRVSWANRFVRMTALSDEGSPFRKGGIPSYEGDVDPVTRWLVDEKIKIARPRRAYVDVETDSRVSFSEKRKMRLLCWSLADDRGEVFARGRLEEDTDADEKRILQLFWNAIEPYDQVVCWNGSFGGRAFDFEILELRSEARGVRFDRRLWHWVDQLPVHEGMNMHAAESGAEKASMRLGDIAQGLLGEGKEEVPDFVRERFGDRCNRGLGALAWDLWEAGGEFRELLFRYNEKDTLLLPRIEGKTKFIELLTAISQACGIWPDMRCMKAGRRVDGFMLRLGAEDGVRFPSKEMRGFGGDDEGAPDEEAPPAHAEAQFKGAIVFDAMTLDPAWRKKHGMTDGIGRDVHVFDFSGMYPSIILSWNMGTDTRAPVPVNGPVPEGFTRSPLTGIGFRKDVEAYLVKALRVLMAKRQYYTDLKGDLPPGTDEWYAAGRLSDALKIVINAFYGDLGNAYSRFHDRSVAESVTQNGVWLIKRVADEAERRNWLILYGDTDGLYVSGPTRESAREFAAWCNKEVFPEMVRGVGCTECAIKLTYEKELEKFVQVSKKRYIANYRHFKWTGACECDVAKDGKTQPGALDYRTYVCRDCGRDYKPKGGGLPTWLPPPRGRPEVKGIEYKRGDTSRIARELQATAIDMLVGGLKVAKCEVPTDDLSLYHGVLGEMRARVLEGELKAEDVRIAKKLTQSPKEYSVKEKKGGGFTEKPPHVRVAEILKKRGRSVGVGQKIEYVVTDGSKSPAEIIPAEDYDGSNADRFHVWEKMVFPPTERLLQAAYPDHDWGEWGKVRPPKVRGRAAKLEEAGQLALGSLPVADLGETRGASPPGARKAVRGEAEEAGVPLVKKGAQYLQGSNGWGQAGQAGQATDFPAREAERLRKEWSATSPHVSVEEAHKSIYELDPDHDPEEPRHP
jgi:DNA polymerase elongation subunit (family B)